MKLRIRSAAAAALLAALALAGCSKTDAGSKSATAKAAQAAALTGYVHHVTDDVFGYYMPDKDYRAGKFVFRNMSLGGVDDFTAYEGGKNAEKNFAPFMLEFDDTTSKQATNELGGTFYKNAPRVLPTAYKVTKTTLAFAGTDKQLGAVAFTGTLDLPALKAAQNGNDKAVVATGDLSFAGKTFKNVKFTWFGGD